MNARTVLVAVACSSALACGPGFDPPSLLQGLRVLAIQSEPVRPATGETSTITPLVYTPPGTPAPTYAWTWCPFAGSASDGYPCLISEEELGALTGGAPVPAYDLGTGETASFENSFAPELFTAICVGMPGQPAAIDCTGGFPVQLKLTVTQGTERVVAVKNLRLRFAPEHEANANPVIDAITAIVGGAPVELGAAPGPTLLRRTDTEVRVTIPTSSIETFLGEGEDGEPAPEKERLNMSWFVETGSVDDDLTTHIDGLTDFAKATKNTWAPDGVDDFPADTADLIVVTRDSRDGVTWARGTAALGGTR